MYNMLQKQGQHQMVGLMFRACARHMLKDISIYSTLAKQKSMN